MNKSQETSEELEDVHTINRSELKRVSQCEKHTFYKTDTNEVSCKKCPTVRILSDKDMYEYLQSKDFEGGEQV